jgi:hypothetical protein
MSQSARPGSTRSKGGEHKVKRGTERKLSGLK